MAYQPISRQSIVTDRSLLKYPEVFGSLDRGCSLTKVLYVKSVPDQLAKASLELAVFANAHFDHVLDWLAARAAEEGASKAAGRKFRVTGVGGEKYRAEIEVKLGMDIEFVDEIISQQRGAHFLLSNFEDKQFCYTDCSEQFQPQVQVEPPAWMKALMMRSQQIYAQNDGKRLPVIFGFCGSGTIFNKINEDGSTDVLGVNWFAGKSFLGLSQLLLGTNDYEEIMELASRGDRRHVDTQAKEMLAQDEKSEYRMIPPDFPLFPFGKASEGKAPLESFSREDMAAAVVGSVLSTVLPLILNYCRNHGVRRVYLGGNFFRAKVARKILMDFVATAPSTRALRIKFLSTGHTGCIGALVTSTEDVQELRTRMNATKLGQDPK